MTPAQAAGVPNYVTDVSTQGPTDPGQRQAACAWAQALPQPACVDCSGPVPPWAGDGGILAERVEYLGRPICCFT